MPAKTLNTEKKINELLKRVLKGQCFGMNIKAKIQTITTGNAAQNIDTKRILLNSSLQGVNKLFVMGFDNNTVKKKQWRYRIT